MRFPGSALWRGIVVVVTIAGMAGVATIWSLLNDPGTGYLILCSLPFLNGGVAAIAGMAMQNRILLLWAAAGLAGLVAVITIMSGTGFVLLAGMALYLIVAWGMNEGTHRPTT